MICLPIGSKVLCLEYQNKHFFVEQKQYTTLIEFLNVFKIKLSMVVLKEACDIFDNLNEFADAFKSGKSCLTVDYDVVEFKFDTKKEKEKEDEDEKIPLIPKISKKELNQKIENLISKRFLDGVGVSWDLIKQNFKEEVIEYNVYYNNFQKAKKQLEITKKDYEFIKLNKVHFFRKKFKESVIAKYNEDEVFNNWGSYENSGGYRYNNFSYDDNY